MNRGTADPPSDRERAAWHEAGPCCRRPRARHRRARCARPGDDTAAYRAAFDWLRRRAQLLLARPEVWCRVAAVAAALLDRDELREQEVHRVCRAAVASCTPWYASLEAPFGLRPAASTRPRVTAAPSESGP